MNTKPPYNTAEEWLNAAWKELVPLVTEAGGDNLVFPDKYQIHLHWDSANYDILGCMYYPCNSLDGETWQIFIHPGLYSPPGIVSTLAHEMIHVAVDSTYQKCCGHRGHFLRVAKALGLESPMRTSPMSEALRRKLCRLLLQLGPLPWVPMGGNLCRKKDIVRFWNDWQRRLARAIQQPA